MKKKSLSWEEAQREGRGMPTLKKYFTYIKALFGEEETSHPTPRPIAMSPIDYYPEDYSGRAVGVRLEGLPKKKGKGNYYYHYPTKSSTSSGREQSEGGLGKAVTSVIVIAGVLGGIFFLSTNITGNAIANVSQNSSNVLGAVLLVVGLVAGFFWVKKK
jgi:hypothetical protein